jgi:adenine-specific DNA methylase
MKKFIEELLPIKEISEESAREKKHKTRAYIHTAYMVGKKTF